MWRQVLMAVLRRHWELSYPEIGWIFGRDHTTVMSGIRKAERMLRQNDRVWVAAFRTLEDEISNVSAHLQSLGLDPHYTSGGCAQRGGDDPAALGDLRPVVGCPQLELPFEGAAPVGVGRG
jgi:hypothetical protein